MCSTSNLPLDDQELTYNKTTTKIANLKST